MYFPVLVALFIFGIRLLQTLPNPHGFQYKYIDFGLDTTLAPKQLTKAGLEAVNLSRRELVRSTIFSTSSKNTPRRLLLSLLLLSGNIESNPGPQYKYPCGECTRPVKSNQRGIQCDLCDVWYHAKCNYHIDLQIYEILANTSLTCPQCGFPNFSDSFFNDSIDSLASPNSFSPIQETTADSSTPLPNIYSTHHKNNKHKWFEGLRSSIFVFGVFVFFYILPNKYQSKVTKCKLTCLALNCKSMKNKVADIAAIIEEHKPDVILGNESWLHPDIKNSEFFP